MSKQFVVVDGELFVSQKLVAEALASVGGGDMHVNQTLNINGDVSPQTVELIQQSQRQVFRELIDAERFRLNEGQHHSTAGEKSLAERVVDEIFHQMFMFEDLEESPGLSGVASIGPIRNKLCAAELSRRLDSAIKLSAEKLQTIRTL